jgi:quercetin dioxygenase-like cupin family protein
MRDMRCLDVALGAAMIGLSGIAMAQEPARPNLLLREIVQGMPSGERQEVRILTATIQPGQATPFHTHRFPVAVYVLDGAFTLEMEGREPLIVQAGGVWWSRLASE